jgi:hydroxymethylglutaryl-CoA reductase
MNDRMSDKTISGFSKLSKRKKIKWIVENFFKDPEHVMGELMSYWHGDEEQQKILDGFSENTLSNFPMPFGVAPNFLINGKTYVVPMVIEESSVVAAASAAAKFWMSRGGFQAEVLSTVKLGQVSFEWHGDKETLLKHEKGIEKLLISSTDLVTQNMRKRGGGITSIKIIDFSDEQKGLYQLKASFETCDSMGANFINTCLESFAVSLQHYILTHDDFKVKDVNIIMCILSNYTPDCLVRAKVTCPIDDLGRFPDGMDAKTFAYKFHQAVEIARIDPHRATTHNKGIFNGIDAVVIATGNDFRAIEACGHTFASRDGQYRSLSKCSIDNNQFTFWLDIPLALGTVGGLTALHPLAKRGLELLGSPKADELMQIIAVTGLAQNFAALRSLVTTGIQKGHMKMHLQNILNQLNVNEEERAYVTDNFEKEVVSFSRVREVLEEFRVNG